MTPEWKTVRMCKCPECGELVQDMDEACLHKCKNTPEEKIAALVEHIKKKFPNGCDKAACKNCVLHNTCSETIEGIICEMLSHINALDD